MDRDRSIEKLLRDEKSLEIQINNLEEKELKNTYEENLLEIMKEDLGDIKNKIGKY